MIERGRGTIINVGSLAWISPFPHLGHYVASRAALAALTEVLRLELEPRGLRVVEVALGPVDTPASRENRRLAGAEQWLDGRPGVGDPKAAAAAITAAVEGQGDGVVFYPRLMRWPPLLPGTGQALLAPSGQARRSPRHERAHGRLFWRRRNARLARAR